VSLNGLSWPLFIGGQVSRFRSDPIQIHRAMAVYILFPYSNIIYVGSYLGPIFLWALTQIYPKGTNATGPSRRTHVTILSNSRTEHTLKLRIFTRAHILLRKTQLVANARKLATSISCFSNKPRTNSLHF
jgi:hypothetical protein